MTIDSLFNGTLVRKYPGYGNERNELAAMYTSERGTEEDFHRAADAYEKVILSGNATTTDYISYGMLHRDRAFRDIKKAFSYYRRAISEGEKCRDLQMV